MSASLNILVIEARFYDEVADPLLAGTKAALVGHTFDLVTVPGILELPSTLLYAWRRGANPDTGHPYDGAVVLGCAVKGETDHYEHVCRESMSGVQRVALDLRIPVGNGILTVPTWELALNRANPKEGDAGGRAARACLRLIEVARRYKTAS
jgi:6,7-dimethyl-8-ribityllumazine synthase